uniref:Nesprin-2-like n=1 Tax=Gouania willdenowi TaxID=441366 RepID=A0A8C5DVF6_GOUWI
MTLKFTKYITYKNTPNDSNRQNDDKNTEITKNLLGVAWFLFRLERRWSLWHEFMKEHAHLEAWLRLAEEAVSPLYSAHVPYADAKEALKKFERLRREAGARLVQLDGLTQRNRTLAQMFQGVMRARLLTVTRESGRRWDDVNVRLEAVTGRLQHFVSEWEEFEAQREELALWLADMSAHLVEIDHVTGSTCEKLRLLQVCLHTSQL